MSMPRANSSSVAPFWSYQITSDLQFCTMCWRNCGLVPTGDDVIVLADVIDTGSPADHRAADAVVASLEARIVSGDLADGAYLPVERELMAAHSISRTVVREAIARLASRGLIEA